MSEAANNLSAETQSTASPTPVVGASERRQDWLACLLLAVICLVVYWPVLGFDFICYDDPVYFANNPRVQRGVTWENLAWAFRATENASWYPLTWLSYLLDAQLFGSGPVGPHFTNLLLHTVNGILLFLFLRRVTGALWESALVAALFALHPLRVESVAWVAERKDVLSAFLGFLSLIFYTRYVGQASRLSPTSKLQRASPRQAGSLSYTMALFFFILGLLSKPVLVTWPFLLLLLDFWPLKRFNGSTIQRFNLSLVTRHSSLLFEKIPFLLLAIIFSIITFRVHQKTGSVVALENFSLGDRIGNAFVSYACYSGKTFWPVNLAVPYLRAGSLPWWQVAPAVVLVAGLCVAAVRRARCCPFFFTGWFWFVGMLVPTIGLVSWGSHSMADRFTYMPSVGLFVALVWGMTGLCAKWRVPWGTSVAIAVLILSACSARTGDQLRHWQNSETLYRHTLAVTGDNVIAHDNLGSYLANQGRLEEAIFHHRRALEINPANATAHNNLGFALYSLGKHAEAVAEYQLALKLKPDFADAHNNLGVALGEDGKLDEAVAHLKEAVRVQPDFAKAYNNLGNALVGLGGPGEAVTQYKKAAQIDGKYADAHFNLARVLVLLGLRDEAMAEYRAALRVNQDFAEAYSALGAVLMKAGQMDEAIQQFREALRLKPKLLEAHRNLAAALAAQGKYAEAIAHYGEVLRLSPGDAEAEYRLSVLLDRVGRSEEAMAHGRRAVLGRPDYAEARQQLGELLVRVGDKTNAVAAWREVMRLKPGWPAPLNSLAWMLATDKDAAWRDGAEAVRLGEWAAQVTTNRVPEVLDTLAAAYAESGRYEKAIKTAQRAIELAEASGKEKLAVEIRRRLKLYKAGRPYRE